jgi:cob(I)alamin adenosyltransferase
VAHRLSRIVTRTGDDGSTGLGDGARIGKASLRVTCLGEVDELNSHIGLLLTEELAAQIRADLTAIQQDLFDLGAELCLPGRSMLRPERVAALDERLAHYNERLPRLQEFILPGGTRASAQAHVCRTVCRRAERALVALGEVARDLGPGESEVSEAARQYCNRLSDLLFVLARTIHRQAGGSAAVEPQWHTPSHPGRDR